jgi:serine/threonine-protein kinase
MPPLLQPGDCCGVFQIIAFVRAAGGAELYLAAAPGGERCFLKMMTERGSDKERLRFAQEGQVLVRILSPGVLRVLGAGAWGAHPWVALEQPPGETLGERLRAGRPPPEDALAWMEQVCSVLEEIHAAGIVHRNLTPDGVHLLPGNVVKLGGFRVARLEAFGVVTTTDHQVGSARSAAPEVLRPHQDQEVGPAADLYGVGVLTYEAIGGCHPLGREPTCMTTTAFWHLNGSARPLREIAPGASAALEALVHQLLEKDPQRRPASAGEVRKRLRAERALLRAPLLRAACNAAPVERPIGLQATQPMPAAPDAAPPGGDRAAMLPTASPAPAPARTLPPTPVAPPVAAPIAPPLAAPLATPLAAPIAPPVAGPPVPAGMSSPQPPTDLRVTVEPVESMARHSRATPRWAPAAVVGASVLALAVGAAIGASVVMGRPTDRAQATGSAAPPGPTATVSAAPPAPSAPAPSTSASAPRPAGPGAAKRPRPPALPPPKH